jgi:hypothetical protein
MYIKHYSLASTMAKISFSIFFLFLQSLTRAYLYMLTYSRRTQHEIQVLNSYWEKSSATAEVFPKAPTV